MGDQHTTPRSIRLAWFAIVIVLVSIVSVATLAVVPIPEPERAIRTWTILVDALAGVAVLVSMLVFCLRGELREPVLPLLLASAGLLVSSLGIVLGSALIENAGLLLAFTVVMWVWVKLPRRG